MKKDFFRKVAFGLGPEEKINGDPLVGQRVNLITYLTLYGAINYLV
jgi:hypothetical protein